MFGSPEYSTDNIPILDPKTNTVVNFKAPVRDPDTPEGLGPGHAAMEKPLGPSPYWGDEKIWDSKVNNHNSMFDKKGRVWMAAAVRGPKNPDFCKKGSDHPSAKLFPLEQTHRALTILDPKTMKYTFVDTCFQTHHLQFAYDANDTLWTSSGGGGGVVGWINTKMWNETGDAAKSQGWTALILDTNGDGKRGEYTEPNQPLDPSKDRRLGQVIYAVMPSPADGFGVGYDPVEPRLGRAHRTGRQPARNDADRNLQRPDAGLRPARRRHRQQGRGLGVARQRPYRQLRPPPVQGPAQRPEGDRRPLPGRLEVLQVSGPGLRGHRR